jgi:hypothetical protein
MKTKTFLGLAAVVITSAALSLAATQDAPSPEMMARMAPGPMHAKLEPLIGSWKMTGKWRMTPDAPWEEFEADVERKWILGKRFIEETVTSEFMGQPFEGVGIVGYDNTREQFTMVWLENMATSTFVSTGKLEGGNITFEGVNSDAWTGEKNKWGKSVVSLTPDNQTFKGYCKDESGKEFQNMEMLAKKR